MIWQVLMGYVAIVGVLFVGAFSRRAWWRSAIGLNVMGTNVSLTATFVLLVTSSVWGPWPRWVWFAVVGAIAVVMTHQLVLLLRTPRDEGES